MNIFVTDPDPVKSAQVLPDKHIVKMPLETCQMLSIVASEKWGHGFGVLPKLNGEPYKTDKGAFRNHPCTVWSQINFRWLIEHGLALCAEYTHRYGKTHSCQYTIECAIIYFQKHTLNPRILLEQCMMSLSTIILSILLQHIKDILHLNLGYAIIIFVDQNANLLGFNNE